MCGIVGGLWLGAPRVDQSYSPENSLSWAVLAQLLKSSGNRGHESVGVYLRAPNNINITRRTLGSVSDFIENNGYDLNRFMESCQINDFLCHIRYATSSGKKRTGKGDDRNNIHPLSINSENYSLKIIENGQTYFDEDNETIEEYTDELMSDYSDEDIGDYISKRSGLARFGATSDTSFKGMKIADLMEQLSKANPYLPFEGRLTKCLSKVYADTFDNGMFSTIGLMTDKNTDQSLFFVMRDGGRPLHWFDLDSYRIFCSEPSPAFDLIQNLLIDLKPENIYEFPAGMIQIYDSATGSLLRETRKQKKKPLCFFEPIYLMRHDGHIKDIFGNPVPISEIRALLGLKAYEEHRYLFEDEDDLVITPVPKSANDYAKYLDPDYNIIGKNSSYRTFIVSDDPVKRFNKANDKFVVSSSVKDKCVVVIEDSLVRYTNAAVINKKLRALGAEKVYYIFGCPPITSPCYGGINSYREHLATTAIELRDGIKAKDIAEDYYGTGAHKAFEEALKYFEHEPRLMELLGGPVVTDGVGFISNAGMDEVFGSLNLPPTSRCCVTDKYPYRFEGIKEGQFIPSAVYPEAISEAIKGRVIA